MSTKTKEFIGRRNVYNPTLIENWYSYVCIIKFWFLLLWRDFLVYKQKFFARVAFRIQFMRHCPDGCRKHKHPISIYIGCIEHRLPINSKSIYVNWCKRTVNYLNAGRTHYQITEYTFKMSGNMRMKDRSKSNAILS